MPLKVVPHKRSRHLYLRGTVRGEYVFETTGTDDPEAADALRIRREQELLTQSVYGKKATATFMEAALRYLENGGSPRFVGTFDDETGKWDGLIGRFGETRLSSIGQNELDEAARALYPRASAATRNRQVYTPFVAIWHDAALRGMCEERTWKRPKDTARGTKARARTPRRGTSATSYDRAARFIAAMSPAAGMTMTALLYTGMRPIELFALEADDVLIESRWIVVRNSKTGEPRGVPMHEFLVPLLQGLKKQGGPVFRTMRNRPYTEKEEGGGQMKTAIAGAARRSGVNDISPYTARHTVSTQLVVAGVHQHIKDQILGHAVTDMSRRYTHVPQQPLIEAINRLPVPETLRSLEWLSDPVPHLRRGARWGASQKKSAHP